MGFARRLVPAATIFSIVCSAAVASSFATSPTYNGIQLSEPWPPRDLDSKSRNVPRVPYLENRPAVVPIDVGRQLLVDDFLIEETSLRRVFHQPVKHPGNPILKPEKGWEQNGGICPAAAPFSDGVFFDPKDGLFKMWYMAGWFSGVALATSKDGLFWERPEFTTEKGTNLVIAPSDARRRDGVSVWLDSAATDPAERFKMFYYGRQGEVGATLKGGGGYLLTSPDGINWSWRGQTGKTRDNTTFFYNPFRKMWVFSHRTRSQNKEQWRDRSYWENRDFLAGLDGWDGYEPVFWLGADVLDKSTPNLPYETQLYKIDAVAYESLMIGLVAILNGPPNDVAAKNGVPKITQLQIAYSRDGFHWDRPSRETFIGPTQEQGSWERGYVTSAGGVCLIVGDKLHFYYGAFAGDATRTSAADSNGQKIPEVWTGMYANASTGLATLRRDGFASLEADAVEGALTTRPVQFNGKHLFANVDCPAGELRVEILDQQGQVIAPFSRDNCVVVREDSTRQQMRWEGGADLSRLAGQPVRFRFLLRQGKLYSFWVSPDQTGASHGFVAAGGPGLTGETDTVGSSATP